MNKIKVGTVALAAAMSLFVGCGGDEPPGVYTLDEFKGAVSEQTCKAFAACGVFESTADCAGFEYPLEGLLLKYSELESAVEGQTVVFDGEAAFACAEALGTRSCASATFNVLPEICQLVLQGVSDENEECFIQQECMSGLSCNSPGFPSCVAGVCRPTPPSMQVPQAGQECIPPNDSRSVPCVAGYGCVDEICILLPSSGEECDFLLGCGDFTERCIFDAEMPGTPGTCLPVKSDGDVCQLGECLNSSRCTDGTCQRAGGGIGDVCGLGESDCLYPLECRTIDGQISCANRTESLICGS